jgi:hypothetical protein
MLKKGDTSHNCREASQRGVPMVVLVAACRVVDMVDVVDEVDDEDRNTKNCQLLIRT